MPPIRKTCSSSHHQSNSFHEAAIARKENFGHSNIPLAQSNSILWQMYERRPNQPLHWSSESSISHYVTMIVDDILVESGLCDLISCENELSLFGKQPDIVLVCKFGIPIGFIEVKKPGNAMNDAMIHGQIFDYLNTLKNYTGIRHPFGILSTYEQWRIFWLPQSSEVAKSQPNTSVSQETRQPSGPPSFLNILPNWNSVDNPQPFTEAATPLQTDITSDDNSTATENHRIVCCSSIIQSNNTSLVHIVLSCIFKMIQSPVDHMSSLLMLPSGRTYIYVTKEGYRWENMPANTSLVIQGRSVPSHFQNAFLLYDLGGGGDGRVWLGATKEGKVCVLKFSEDGEMLKQEKDVWDAAWPECKVIVKQLNPPYFALIMPWVKPCTKKEFQDPSLQNAISGAVEKLGNAGYKHDDLHFRHIGFYEQDNQTRALLFDFARVSITKTSQEAITDMMSRLTLNNETDD